MNKELEAENITNMVFDRNAAAGHQWDGALNDLEASDGHDDVALHDNCRMDHRVSIERERNVLNSPGLTRDIDGSGLKAFWMNYGKPLNPKPFGSTLKTDEHACFDPLNRNNIITNGPAGFDQLVHVDSFNRLLKFAARNHLFTDPNIFEDEFAKISNCDLTLRNLGSHLPDNNIFNANVDKLATELNGQGNDVVRNTVLLLRRTLREYKPFWWACFAEEVAGYIQEKDWAQLCLALGLGHFEEEEWILIWRYNVADAGQLYRPTMLETRASPYHYPSPPSSDYGVAMPLNASLPACREIAHKALPDGVAAVARVGELVQIKDFAGEKHQQFNELPKTRRAHNNRLKREFTETEDNEWFERHKYTI